MELNRIHTYDNGLTLVEKDCKYNLVNSKGQILCKEWFDIIQIFNFDDSPFFAKVVSNRRVNIISRNGDILSEQWFDHISFKYTPKYIIVWLDEKVNLLKPNLQYAFDQWFDNILFIDDNLVQIKKDNLWNLMFIDTNQLVCQEWFDMIDTWYYKYLIVKKNNKFNIIDLSGNFMLDFWFDNVHRLNHTSIKIELNGKFIIFDINTGSLATYIWCDYIKYFNNDWSVVRIDNSYNLVNFKSNDLFSEEWFESLQISNTNSFLICKKDGKWNIIDCELEYEYEEWLTDSDMIEILLFEDRY